MMMINDQLLHYRCDIMLLIVMLRCDYCWFDRQQQRLMFDCNNTWKVQEPSHYCHRSICFDWRNRLSIISQSPLQSLSINSDDNNNNRIHIVVKQQQITIDSTSCYCLHRMQIIMTLMIWCCSQSIKFAKFDCVICVDCWRTNGSTMNS